MGRFRPADKTAARVRQSMRYAALARANRRLASNYPRVSPDGVVSAPIKQNDAQTEALIQEALLRMRVEKE